MHRITSEPLTISYLVKVKSSAYSLDGDQYSQRDVDFSKFPDQCLEIEFR